jgi:hypothetical protein
MRYDVNAKAPKRQEKKDERGQLRIGALILSFFNLGVLASWRSFQNLQIARTASSKQAHSMFTDVQKRSRNPGRRATKCGAARPGATFCSHKQIAAKQTHAFLQTLSHE